MADKDGDVKGRKKADDAAMDRPYDMKEWRERYKD